MTTTELNTAAGFETAWAERAAARGESPWSAERRRAAAGTLRTLKFPSREDELWRRTDFRTLEAALPALDPFVAPEPVREVERLPQGVLERLGEEALCAAMVVHVDGAAAFEQVPDELERRGVILCSLDRAAADFPERLAEVYGSLLHDDYDWYVALGSALRSGGAFVYVPDGVELTEPLRIVQWITRPGILTAPRSVVVLGRGAKAVVVDEKASHTAEGIAFNAGGAEVVLGEDAKLVYGTLQDWGRNVYDYSNQRATVGRGAELQWIQTLLGSRMAKANSYFDLAGSGAQVFVHGFMFGDARQHFHLHTLQRHLVDHTTSDLLIKSCLKDRARSIYQGLIQVSEGAQRTDAYQANRNLLLSDTARADSIPGLEILANDVRCTHGATIGHVDEEQMYYLMTRGLPRLDAQRLIVEGFFAPVLDRIPLESVRAQLHREIARKIG